MITNEKYLTMQKKHKARDIIGTDLRKEAPYNSGQSKPLPQQDFASDVKILPAAQTIRIAQGGGYSPSQYQGKPDTAQWFGAFEGVQIRLLVEIRDLLTEIRDGKKKEEKTEEEPSYMNDATRSRRNDWIQTRG